MAEVSRGEVAEARVTGVGAGTEAVAGVVTGVGETEMAGPTTLAGAGVARMLAVL